MANPWEEEFDTPQGGMPWDTDFVEQQAPQLSPAEQAAQQVAQDTGTGEAILVGAGRTLDKLGSGTMDLFDRFSKYLGSSEADKSMQEREAEQQMRDESYRALEEEKPVATFTGEALPYLATLPIGMTGGGARTATHLAAEPAKNIAARNIARESAIGAAEGAAHYDDTALSGALWGSVGGAGGQMIGNILGGKAKVLNPESQRIVDFAKKEGMYVPPGMATGDRKLQQIDQALATHRSTADKIADKRFKDKQIENRIISEELGGPKADILSVDYLNDQRSRIKGDMDKLVSNTEGKVTEDMAYRATKVIDEYKLSNPDMKSKPILDKFEQQLYDMADSGDTLTGKQYQDYTKRLNKAASSQYSSPMGDRDLAKALSDISSIYDDAIEEGLSSSKKSDWNKSRKQYALLSAIEKTKEQTTDKTGHGVEGFVNTKKLAKNFKASDKINKLAEVQRLRDAQAGSSLGTSGLVAKAMNVTEPASAIGPAMLLGGRASSRVGLGPINNLVTDLYTMGYPHATGALPIFGRKYTEPMLQRGVARSLMANTEREE